MIAGVALGDIPADIDCRKAADTLARVRSAKGDGFFKSGAGFLFSLFTEHEESIVSEEPFCAAAEPVLDALASVRGSDSYCISLTPSGTPYTQDKAHVLAAKQHLILLCGHYEGMDARIGHHMDEEISIGDYVLTGGEIGAMVIVDSVTRLLDGAIREESTKEESFENGLLEYPQYTKPADYQGDRVPDVLVSGNHQKIAAWRHAQALLKTAAVRPDLLRKQQLSKEDENILAHPEEWQ